MLLEYSLYAGCFFSVINIISFGFFYSYICSYYHIKNPNINYEKFMICTFFANIGFVFGNLMLQKSIAKIGLLRSQLLGGFLYLFNGVTISLGSSMIYAYASFTLVGFANQFTLLPILMQINRKMGKQANYYTTIILSFAGVGMMIWTSILRWIVNPDNIKLPVNLDGSPSYFPIEIARRIAIYFSINGLSAFIFSLLIYFNIEEAKNKSTHTPEELVQFESESNKMVFSFEFLIIMIIGVIRHAPLFYLNNNGKVIGLLIDNDDKLINNLFSFTMVFNVIGRLSAGLLWQKFGFFFCFALILCLDLVIDISMMTMPVIGVYSTMLVIHRFNIGQALVYNNLFVFSIYGTERAIHIFKYFDTNLIMSLAVVSFVNSVFGNSNFQYVNFVFIIGEITGLYLLARYLRDYRPLETLNLTRSLVTHKEEMIEQKNTDSQIHLTD